MGRWTVRNGRTDLFAAESLPDGRVSLHIPSAEAVAVTAETAEHIRLAIGAAIGTAHRQDPG
ncbi:hypothetical protein [Actinophytocola glycyrrhizae]|uniref:Uncharacterized protein n=1 Tax=Actinophytocola glycyrrhizae TaxID=2044873 RepID=A0ABV9S457_9PSEU